MQRVLSVFAGLAAMVISASAVAQVPNQTKGDFEDKFRQLEEVLPTANVYRAASGAPGHEYWQQQVDYEIEVTVDDATRVLTGTETITYRNNSPDTLKYLWLQLDQNRFARHSDQNMTRSEGSKSRRSMNALRSLAHVMAGDHGHKISAVRDARGNDLAHVIVDTVMRIDLPEPLASGSSVSFSIDWSYNIIPGRDLGGRGGYEEWEDGNNVFFISQWFPRLSAYSDNDGWNTKAFLGAGEFTLEFGSYDVRITVPSDHIVASTGELQNASRVLTEIQQDRLDQARTAENPVFIVTPEEAALNEAEAATGTKTWHFTADDVRDFAFASSRKFVWDALGYEEPSDGRIIMAMSFYPNEGIPLWDQFSTHAIAHTLKTYSYFAFPYPYSKAQSVLGPIGGGMEYPMITSNGPRTTWDEKLGERTYSRRAKYFLIGVVIHEVGHTWFPMVVNSDERNWTWMDEGLNSFLDSASQQLWEPGYRNTGSEPRNIVTYMLSENQVPVMTQSDSLLQFGPNAYSKPATALNILRETILGRELFDFAFREYSNRWKFKRPHPADFFRTMEDASGKDLDWFWRGWFYSTDHVDISIEGVTLATVNTQDPDAEAIYARAQRDAVPQSLMEERNQSIPKYTDRYPDLLEFYNHNDQFTVTEKQRKKYQKMVKDMEDWEAETLNEGRNFYFIDFKNIGGLVMPLILDIQYTDGTSEERRLPAEFWRRDSKNGTYLILTDKELQSITLDPHLETADADLTNNNWPPKPVLSRLELFKQQPRGGRDLMHDVKVDEMGDAYNDDDEDEDGEEDGEEDDGN